MSLKIDGNKEPKIEDIFPLTIVSMRYGGKIVILNCDADSNKVSKIQETSEPSYDVREWLDENVTCANGVGSTISEAFEDFKKQVESKMKQ